MQIEKIEKRGWYWVAVWKSHSGPCESWIYDGKAKRCETDWSREGDRDYAIQDARDIAEDIAKRELRGYEEAEIICYWGRPATDEEDEDGFVPEDKEVATFRIVVPDGKDEEGEPLPWEVVED